MALLGFALPPDSGEKLSLGECGEDKEEGMLLGVNSLI